MESHYPIPYAVFETNMFIIVIYHLTALLITCFPPDKGVNSRNAEVSLLSSDCIQG